MLDYRELDKKVTELLNNTSTYELLGWLDEKIERENRERILNQEIAVFLTGNCTYNSITSNYISYQTIKSAGENNYALAA